MKVSVKKTQLEFSPIELVITIENNQELNAFKKMFSANISIPDFLTEKGLISDSYKVEFSEILSALYTELK